MRFRAVHGGEAQINRVNAFLCRGIKGKGMTGLVGEHIHVGAGAVEIGEDEGIPVFLHESAVSAGGLSFLGFHVE